METSDKTDAFESRSWCSHMFFGGTRCIALNLRPLPLIHSTLYLNTSSIPAR